MKNWGKHILEGCFVSLLVMSLAQAVDVGVTQIVAPAAVIDSGDTVVPSAWVRNFGTQAEGFQAAMRIGTFYSAAESVQVGAGESTLVTFPHWPAIQRGAYLVKCSTMCQQDTWPANDARAGSVLVRVIDNEVVNISPSPGGVPPGSYVVKAWVINLGTNTNDAGVTFDEYDAESVLVYSNTLTQTLTPGQEAAYVFWSFDVGAGETLYFHFRVSPYLSDSGFRDTTFKVWGLPDGIAESNPGPRTPDRLVLEAGFPNPFSNHTLIRYAVPSMSWVILQVFAPSGRLVRTLVDEGRKAGFYSAAWDGRDDRGRKLEKGVYICRIKSGGFSLSRKLIEAGGV